jgi:peptidyl-dipeptidase Dcp
MNLRTCLACGAAVALSACASSTAARTAAEPQRAAQASSTNPLLAPSTLPFGAPPFDRIRDTDYQPAIEEGMRQHLIEIERIANQTSPPTFDNTIVAMERSGDLLTRATSVFFAIVQANSDSTLERVQTEEAPRLAAHSDEIYLNPKLFDRVRTLYDRRDALGLTPEQRTLVERYYEDFVRAGAKLSEQDKTRLRALNQEESTLSTSFQTKLLAATKNGALVVSDRTALAGLSDAEIAAAAAAATARGMPGKWVIPLQNTTQQPAMASLSDRATRERLFTSSTQRAEHGDSTDTRSVIQRLAAERAARAKLLGYPTYAAYALENQMAKTPDAAIRLLTSLVPAANARAASEAQAMQALIDQQHGGFRLAPQDWQYYAEQVRKAKYELDESQIRPYFELDRVLHDGVFFAANRLYGLTFRERKDIPVYEPSVRVFEVFDKDGKSLALWYADYFKRDNKGGGAWEDAFVRQSGLLGRKPVIFNVANFPKPAPGQPALLSFNDATTMFHEFGHALHDMFSNVEYPTLAGTNVPRDFVEFPSQFNEHWALDSTVFANYAKHYQTGQPMPRALVDKIKASRTFNQGYATTESLEAMLLDMAWHTLPAGAPLQPVDSFETAALRRFDIANPLIPPRYRSSYFAHIWDGGYAAGYYAYLWSEVLDDDAYAWFIEHGGLTRENGQRFRDMVLSRGHTQELGALYRAFRGRDPDVSALIRERGLTPPASTP